MIGVVTVERRQMKCGRQTRLAVLQQIVKSLVRLPRRSESRQLRGEQRPSRSEGYEAEKTIDRESGANDSDQHLRSSCPRDRLQRGVTFYISPRTTLIHRQEKQSVVSENDRKPPVTRRFDRHSGVAKELSELVTGVSPAMLVVVVAGGPETPERGY